MIYLLDVSALIALGFMHHQFHDRTTAWLDRLNKQGTPEFATCSISELGFVRVLSQGAHYGVHTGVEDARALLLELKQREDFRWTFIPDGNDVSKLPRWTKYSSQVTDAHLAQLAKSNHAVLATFNRGIPGAFVIP